MHLHVYPAVTCMHAHSAHVHSRPSRREPLFRNDELGEKRAEASVRTEENLTANIPVGRVLVFVEFRGAAAGVSHCASTSESHWVSRRGDGKNGGGRSRSCRLPT